MVCASALLSLGMRRPLVKRITLLYAAPAYCCSDRRLFAILCMTRGICRRCRVVMERIRTSMSMLMILQHGWSRGTLRYTLLNTSYICTTKPRTTVPLVSGVQLAAASHLLQLIFYSDASAAMCGQMCVPFNMKFAFWCLEAAWSAWTIRIWTLAFKCRLPLRQLCT